MASSGISEPLKNLGAKRRETPAIGVGWLFFPKKDDPKWGHLTHPRKDDPLDEALRDDIVECGEVKESILVWELRAEGHEVTQGGHRLKKGAALLVVCDGSQRSVCGLDAERVLHKKGLLSKDKEFYVPIARFKPRSPETATRDFLVAMQSHDSQRLKKEHSPGVIATIYARAHKYGATVEELLAAAPNGFTIKIVECLLDWGSLHPDAAKAFDHGYDGRVVHVQFLPAIMKLPHSEQLSAIATLVEGEVTSLSGATRALRAQAREDAFRAVGDEGSPSNVGMPPAPATKPADPNGRKKATERTGMPARQVRRVAAVFAEMPKTSKVAKNFVLGALLDLGEAVEYGHMSADATALVEGLLFNRGLGKKGDVPDEVRAALKVVLDEDKAKEKAKADKAEAAAEKKRAAAKKKAAKDKKKAADEEGLTEAELEHAAGPLFEPEASDEGDEEEEEEEEDEESDDEEEEDEDE